MTRGGGWLFIDAKLDYDTRDTLGYLARLCGREHELYVLNVNDPEHSNSYNPILSGDADEVASRLLNLVPSSETDPGADHYRQSANQALTVFVGALKACKLRYNFTDLAILLQSGAALEQLLRMTPQGPERMALGVLLDKFRKGTPQGAQIDVNEMNEGHLGRHGRAHRAVQSGQVWSGVEHLRARNRLGRHPAHQQDALRHAADHGEGHGGPESGQDDSLRLPHGGGPAAGPAQAAAPVAAFYWRAR